MKKGLFYLAFFILYLMPFNLTAAEEKKSDRWGVGFLPIIGYDDESDWVFGAASVFYFHPDPDNKDQEVDELDLTATYSLRGAYGISTDIIKNFRGNDRYLNLETGYEKTINDFYSTGGNSQKSDKVTYTAIDVPSTLKYSFRIYDRLYFDAIYDSWYHDFKGMENSKLLPEDIETDGSYSSGLGLGLTYKTTNPGIYKRRGYSISLSGIYYSPVILSSSSFSYSGLTYKHYFPVLGKCVLGFHFQAERTAGDVPIHYLPALGGSKLLRGIDESRYIAKNSMAGQTEFRFPIWWRFGGTVFAGAGEVADRVEDFGTHIKAAAGLGFRVAVKRKESINIRFDISYNSDGELKKYIKIKEAF